MRFAAFCCASLLYAVTLAQPSVTAKSALIVEAQSGMTLYEKNANAKRFPASTTKILTALLLLENTSYGEEIVAPADTESVTGASLYLEPGERISREDALFALMLRSANDVAHAVAVAIAGSDVAFAQMMNERAKEIGCKSTSFNNPHGLNDDKHSTSAHDLALIAREAMRNPEFRLACRTQSHVISRSINTQDTLLKSHNKLLKADPLIAGIKTGYTIPAGKCFVGYRNLDGFEIITVVLASKDWIADTKVLYNWAHKGFTKDAVLRKGAIVGKSPVTNGSLESVDASLSSELVVLSPRGKPGSALRYTFFERQAPVLSGQVVGEAVLQIGKSKHIVPLVAAHSVAVQSANASVFPSRFLWLFAAIGGGVFASRVIRKNGRTPT